LLQFLKSRLPKSTFWRNFTLMVGGSAVGQGLTIAASPVLSRLYTPSDFGLLSVYTSITSIIVVVSTWSYHQAIPAPESDEDGASLTLLSLGLALLTAALAGVVLAFAHEAIEHAIGLTGFAPYFVAVPLGVIGASGYEIFSQWAVRKKAFGDLARTSAQRGFAQAGTQLALGFAKVGGLGLLAGQVLGQWSGTLRIARRAWREDGAALRSASAASVLSTARRFRRFPLLTLPGAVLNAVDANVAPLLFAHFFGSAVTGYFALGHRLVSVPFLLIASSAQKVFYPAAAKAKQQGTLATETAQTYIKLIRVILPIVVLMTASAPEVFAIAMGAKWREAGVYMQWLSLRACFTMIVFPLTPLIFVLDRQAVGSLFSGLQLVVRIGSVLVGSYYEDPRLAVGLLGTGTGVLWLGYMFYLLAISGASVALALRQLVVELVLALALAAPVFGLKLVTNNDLAITAVATACGLLGLLVILRRSAHSRSA
jgi:O-antigen/teichoic acid export membrane protein